MKIFVDTDSDIRLVRRLRRDISERGRDIAGVIKQYNKFVKPAFDQYIQPTMRLADIVVPRGEPAGRGWGRPSPAPVPTPSPHPRPGPGPACIPPPMCPLLASPGPSPAQAVGTRSPST